MASARQLLDQVQSLERLAELEAAPHDYAARVADEVAAPEVALAALEAHEQQLRDALAQLDALTERVFRLRLERALADDTSIQAPTRKVFASTILNYVGRLELLETRARDVAARGGARDATATAARVVDAAAAALGTRDALRAPVLALIRERAAALLPAVVRVARDRTLADAVRTSWSAARRELEAIAAEPGRIGYVAWPVRVKDWEPLLDDPEPQPEVNAADLIELD